MRIVCTLFVLSWLAGTVQAQQVGDVIMPRVNAKFMVGKTEVPAAEFEFPLTVRKIEGNWLLVGKGWIQRNNVVPLAQAPAHYTEFLKRNRNQSTPYNLRGIAWNAAGDHDKAIADFSEAIRLAPADALQFRNRGNCWTAKGDHASAIKDYSEAIRLNPRDAISYYNRGLAWYAGKDWQKSIEDCRKAIELDANYPLPCNHLAWLLATCPDPRFRDGAQAVEQGTRACELSQWANSGWIGTLALASAEAGDFEQAIKWLNRAIELDPDSHQKIRQEMLALFQQGKPWHQQ